MLELISEFCKVARYEINIQKVILFLYTDIELSENKFKKGIPFTKVLKRKKNLRNRYNKRSEGDIY